jgi:hypothetical protein
MDIPFDILKKFVAEYVRSSKIEQLEQAEVDDILVGK